jgi:hypothetical protein
VGLLDADRAQAGSSEIHQWRVQVLQLIAVTGGDSLRSLNDRVARTFKHG